MAETNIDAEYDRRLKDIEDRGLNGQELSQAMHTLAEWYAQALNKQRQVNTGNRPMGTVYDPATGKYIE